MQCAQCRTEFEPEWVKGKCTCPRCKTVYLEPAEQPMAVLNEMPAMVHVTDEDLVNVDVVENTEPEEPKKQKKTSKKK